MGLQEQRLYATTHLDDETRIAKAMQAGSASAGECKAGMDYNRFLGNVLETEARKRVLASAPSFKQQSQREACAPRPGHTKRTLTLKISLPACLCMHLECHLCRVHGPCMCVDLRWTRPSVSLGPPPPSGSRASGQQAGPSSVAHGHAWTFLT